MPGTESLGPEEARFILSNMPPSQAQQRLALGIVVTLAVALALVIGPFGGIHLGVLHPFVAVYTTAMFVTDLLTAILLFAQFSILRSRAILVIACGYLFTALIIVPYALAFPGVFAPSGVVGGLQTTAHLYLVWHCGFPLFVTGYALVKDDRVARPLRGGQVGGAIVRSIMLASLGAVLASVMCIQGTTLLPRIMLDETRFVPDWPWVVGAPILTLCTVALAVLWSRRRSVLDLFLLVVLCAYIVEVPPHYYPSPARFSTGWYAVRVTSLLSSTIVLTVLLYEVTELYGGLLVAVVRQRREREARLMTGDAVAASIAHEIRQPLTAMVTSADAGLRFLDRVTPNLEKAKDAFKNIAADGHRAGDVIASLRSSFKAGVQEHTALDLNELIRDALTLGRRELQEQGVHVRAEPNRELPAVTGNHLQLQQVLLNLIMNAVDAMAAREEPKILTVMAASYDTDRVVVSVADNGAGISSDHSDRIFNPLFTTKSGGMGLGLSICQAIIEAHSGRLWFAENHPRGSIFHFTLQVSDPGSAAG